MGYAPTRRLKAGGDWLAAFDTHPVPPAQLLVPATVVPMTSEIGGLVGHNDEVICTGRDRTFAAGAQVSLGSLVGLHRGDGHVEKMAHAIRASIAAMATTTMMMSKVVFFCSRKGLKPTSRTVTRTLGCLPSRR